MVKTSKSRAVAIFLSIFFGYLGLDLFYLGYPVAGFLKLVTLGYFVIGWPITALLIISGAIHPADGTWN